MYQTADVASSCRTSQDLLCLSNPLDHPVPFSCQCTNTRHFTVTGLSEGQVDILQSTVLLVHLLKYSLCLYTYLLQQWLYIRNNFVSLWVLLHTVGSSGSWVKYWGTSTVQAISSRCWRTHSWGFIYQSRGWWNYWNTYWTTGCFIMIIIRLFIAHTYSLESKYSLFMAGVSPQQQWTLPLSLQASAPTLSTSSLLSTPLTLPPTTQSPSKEPTSNTFASSWKEPKAFCFTRGSLLTSQSCLLQSLCTDIKSLWLYQQGTLIKVDCKHLHFPGSILSLVSQSWGHLLQPMLQSSPAVPRRDLSRGWRYHWWHLPAAKQHT